MSLKFILGRSGSGKSTYINNAVCKVAYENPKSRYLVVVPDQFTMQTQADMVKASVSKGIMNIEVLSFNRLAHRVFEETGGGRCPVLDDTGKNLILRKCAGDVLEKIPYLSGNINKAGYIHEVKSAISEFMQYGIAPDNVSMLKKYAADSNRITLKNKLGDLEELYKYFTEYIKEQYITTEEAMDILAEEIYKSRIMNDSCVIFDGFTGFTPVQNKVIAALLDVCRQVIIAIPLDGSSLTEEVKEQELFAFTKKTYLSLVELAKERNCVIEEPLLLSAGARFSENLELKYLEKNIFQYPIVPYKDKCDRIYLDNCHDVNEEVGVLVRNIRKLVRDEGARYKDIAVVSGNLPAYEAWINEKCIEYDIPVYIDTTKGIVLNPFVEYIKSSLLMIRRDFSYDSVMQYLRTGFTALSMDEIDIFETYIVETGIKGISSYLKPFTRKTLAMREEERRDKGMDGVSGNADEEENGAEASNNNIADDGKGVLGTDVKNNRVSLIYINNIRIKMMEELESLIKGGISRKGSIKISSYIKSIYNFIAKTGANAKLLEYGAEFKLAGDYAKALEYEQIYTHTCKMFEQMYQLIGEESMDLEEFCGILDAGFMEIRVGMIPQSADRIIVGDLERTRLKPVKYLFFIGLNDGWVPKAGAKGGLISDIDREFLINAGATLSPSPRMQTYIGRFYLYSNMAKPSEKLYLSYTAMDNEGAAMRPSYVVDMVERLFPGICGTRIENNKYYELNTKKEAGELVAALANKYAEGKANADEKHMLFNLSKGLKGDESFLEGIIRNAFFRYEKQSLDKRIAGILYGSRLYASISRMETYAKCAYSYFLQYGIGLKEREEYEIDASDMGMIYHGVLEEFVKLLEEHELDWFTFTEEEAGELINEAVERQAVIYTDAILFENDKNLYILDKMKQIMLRTVNTLAYQLRKGNFKPVAYEYSFRHEQSLGELNLGLNEEERLYLTGKIDRLDVSDRGEKILVKIVDYKSGKKDFSLMGFYHGVQLQMVVYMNEAVKDIQKKNPDKEVIPAAMLYYHINDPLVEAESKDTIENIEEKVLKELKTRGLVNASEDIISNLDVSGDKASDVIPVSIKSTGGFSAASEVMSEADMKLMSEYADYKVLSLAKDIFSGNIELNPIELKKSDKGVLMNSCEYCSYKRICGFDEHMPGYTLKKIEKQEDDILLENMAKELGKERDYA